MRSYEALHCCARLKSLLAFFGKKWDAPTSPVCIAVPSQWVVSFLFDISVKSYHYLSHQLAEFGVAPGYMLKALLWKHLWLWSPFIACLAQYCINMHFLYKRASARGAGRPATPWLEEIRDLDGESLNHEPLLASGQCSPCLTSSSSLMTLACALFRAWSRISMCLRWSSLAERTAASSISNFSFSFKCSLSGRKTRTRAAPGGQLTGPGSRARGKLPHPYKNKNYVKQQRVGPLQHSAETQWARSFYWQSSAPQCPALRECQQQKQVAAWSASGLAELVDLSTASLLSILLNY